MAYNVYDKAFQDMDANERLKIFANNPALAQQEIARAQAVGSSAAQDWIKSIQANLPKPTTSPTQGSGTSSSQSNSSPAGYVPGAGLSPAASNTTTATQSAPKTYTDVYDPSFLNLSAEERLNILRGNKDLAQKEILRDKEVWKQKNSAGDTSGAGSAHDWADMVRGAAGIDVNDPIYGNAPDRPTDNYSKTPVQQPTPTQPAYYQQQPSQPAQTSYQSTYKGPDIEGMKKTLEAMYGDRYASELAKLRNARDTALQGYDLQTTTTKQNAYDQRNQSDTSALQTAQRLKEIMAEQGLVNSGDNVTANVSLQNQRAQQLYDITRNEGNMLGDIAAKKSLLNNQEASNEQALQQAINADKAQQIYDLLKYGDQMNFNIDNRDYGRFRDNVNDQFRNDQASFDRAAQIAQLMGYWPGNGSAGTGTPTGTGSSSFAPSSYGIPAGQQTMASRNADRSYELQKSGQDFSQNFQTQQFEYQKARDAIKDQQYKQQFDEDARRFGLNYAMQQAQLNGQLANQAADNAFQREKFDWEKSQSLNQPAKSENVTGYASQLMDTFGVKDPISGRVAVPSEKLPQLRQAIISMNLSDPDTDKLLSLFGLPIAQ